MSDYNQALSVPEAMKRIQALDAEGLFWIEEPTLAHDYAGYARIRAKAGTAIQMGENWWGGHEMAQCLEAGGSDLGMPDAIGRIPFMTTGKESITASIEAAKANLQQALAGLNQLPAFDAEAFGFALHALNNYLAVTGGLASLLSDALVEHPDAEVQTWLEALHHATDLMTQTLRQMSKDGDCGEVTLVREKVDAPKAVQRVCTYYQKLAERKGIRVIFESAVESPAHVREGRARGKPPQPP
jgi:L-alanine-DL-glutamate epimerase-like enolase superfamily enzyme